MTKTTPKNYTVEPDIFDGTYLVAKSIIDGSYIGLPDFAQHLEDMGIIPQRAQEGHNVASIGFCEAEQKWYGWSHRAMFGFGIGSTVSFGDCAYFAKDWDDHIQSSVNFWSEPSHLNVSGRRGKDNQGVDVALITWTYASDAKLIPNLSLHGATSEVASYPPARWGRGEWTAKTLEDAKQMAMDFAEGVA